MAKRAELIDPEITYPLPSKDKPFAAYIEACRSLIQRYRLDLNTDPLPEKVIDYNCPTEFNPEGRVGVLLVHGLLDSPFTMRDIALRLSAQGLRVRTLLLPGHGTVPGALLNVKYESWLETVNAGIQSFASEVDQLYYIGHSTGASVGLLHALQNPDTPLAGLVMLAPVLKIASSLDFLQGFLLQVGRFWKRFQWFCIEPENDYVKYQSIAMNSGYQVYRLAQAIWGCQQSLSVPLHTIMTQNDKTVSTQATLRFLQERVQGSQSLLLYTPSNSTNLPFATARPAAYPEKHIRDISHVALPFAPDNSHYGENGDYIHASHIEVNLLSPTPTEYGTEILSFSHSKQRPYSRLSFNPDFDFMMQTIMQFIDL